jgi:hypothetical protein
MKIIKLGAVALAAAVAALVMVPADADASRKAKRQQCFAAAGDGTAISADLARLNAKQALDGVIAKQKAKARGKVKYECSTTAVVVNNCRASQRACR